MAAAHRIKAISDAVRLVEYADGPLPMLVALCSEAECENLARAFAADGGLVCIYHARNAQIRDITANS